MSRYSGGSEDSGGFSGSIGFSGPSRDFDRDSTGLGGRSPGGSAGFGSGGYSGAGISTSNDRSVDRTSGGGFTGTDRGITGSPAGGALNSQGGFRASPSRSTPTIGDDDRSLLDKISAGDFGAIEIDPAATLGGIAGFALGGPLGAAALGKIGGWLGDQVGLGDDMALNEMFDGLDFPTGAPRTEAAMQDRRTDDGAYRDTAAAIAPAAPAPAAPAAPTPVEPAGIELLYGPYADPITGERSAEGRFADLARKYGVL